MYTLFFLLLLKNIDCGYSLEPPCGAVITSTHNLCFEQEYGNYFFFYLKIFSLLEVKFSMHLKRCVFVMICLHNGLYHSKLIHLRSLSDINTYVTDLFLI